MASGEPQCETSASATPRPARSMSRSREMPAASVARSTARASAAVSSSTKRSVPPAARARVALQVAGQPFAVIVVALHAGHEVGVRGQERQVEQLRLGLLLGVDALLLVALEL